MKEEKIEELRLIITVSKSVGVEPMIGIRARLLSAFERAEVEPDPERRRQLMTCVVVGGGPTGVELAGALAEIARHTLRDDFRHIDPTTAAG